MRYPEKIPKGRSIDGFAQHIDLLPTILEMTGAPTGFLQIDGKSILPFQEGIKIRDQIFMEQVSMQRAVRTKKWKLINDMMRRTIELYNIENDPLETNNLMETEVNKMEELKGNLDNWVRTNLADGESDPIFYDQRIHSGEWKEYLEKTSKILKNLERSNER